MPVRLPNRRKTQWDYLLEEMAWMAEDFKQERVWKEAAARGLSLSVLSRPKPNPRKSDSAGATDVEADLKARAKAVSDTVTSHWSQCGNAGPLADDGVKNYAVWAKYKGEEAPEPGNGRKQAPEGEGPVKTLEEAGKALADFGEKASELGLRSGDVVTVIGRRRRSAYATVSVDKKLKGDSLRMSAAMSADTSAGAAPICGGALQPVWLTRESPRPWFQKKSIPRAFPAASISW